MSSHTPDPTLYVETHGHGRDLVLLHGWAMQSAIWTPVLAELAKQYRVHLVDLPGHGQSARCPLLPLETAVNQLQAVVSGPAIWVGWSMGGLLATRLASNYPEKVANLLLVASSPLFIQRPAWQPAMPVSQLDQMASQLQRNAVGVLKRFVALQFLGTKIPRQILQDIQTKVVSYPANLQALQAGLEILKTLDLREAFARLEMPVSGIYGANDKIVPASVTQAVQRLNPQFTPRIIEGAGHAPFVSHSVPFIRYLNESIHGQ